MANSRLLPKKRQDEIEELAWRARGNMGLAPFDRVPVARLLELVLPRLIADYEFCVTDADLDGADAITHSVKPKITFSASAYRQLHADKKRARMTGLHELGHLMLHTGQLSYAFQRSKSRQRNIEAEADLFAAAFMMPECAFRRVGSITEAMHTFGVSRDAACHRARDLKLWELIRETKSRSARPSKKGYRKTRTP